MHCCLWRREEGIRPLELQLEVVGDHMVLGTKSGSSASVPVFLSAEFSLQPLFLYSRAYPHLDVYHAHRAGQSQSSNTESQEQSLSFLFLSQKYLEILTLKKGFILVHGFKSYSQ